MSASLIRVVFACLKRLNKITTSDEVSLMTRINIYENCSAPCAQDGIVFLKCFTALIRCSTRSFDLAWAADSAAAKAISIKWLCAIDFSLSVKMRIVLLLLFLLPLHQACVCDGDMEKNWERERSEDMQNHGEICRYYADKFGRSTIMKVGITDHRRVSRIPI